MPAPALARPLPPPPPPRGDDWPGPMGTGILVLPDWRAASRIVLPTELCFGRIRPCCGVGISGISSLTGGLGVSVFGAGLLIDGWGCTTLGCGTGALGNSLFGCSG